MDNLYGSHVFMIDSGTFWRCRHGHTSFIPCWQCGMFHPIKYIKDLWSKYK